MRWYRSLGFTGTAILVIIGLALILAMVSVINSSGKRMVLAESARLTEQIGNTAVEELLSRLHEIAGLAKSLGIVAQEIPRNADNFVSLIPAILDYKGDRRVAGGGVWPEPFLFDSAMEKRSFFWGRQGDSSLLYYDDYNSSETGYHRQKWYVVGRYTPWNKGFWSESYIDPFTLRPMVTCTVPMFQGDEYSGVVTVDLALDGLDDLVAAWGESSEGYAFLVDRNNRFISFPETERITFLRENAQGETVEERKLASALAVDEGLFLPISQAMDTMNREILETTRRRRGFDESLIEGLVREGDGINREEAEMISAVLLDPLRDHHTRTRLYASFEIPDDALLAERSIVSIFHVPESYWKLVLVKPYSAATMVASRLVRILVTSIGILLAAGILLMFVTLHGFLVRPLRNTTKAARIIGEQIEQQRFEDLGDLPIGIFHSNEIGVLTRTFNTLLKDFVQVHEQLQESSLLIAEQNRTLEKKVQDRTRALEESIKTLQETRESLVISEKMAAMGTLVSGVSHEIATPIGIAMTAVSYLNSITKNWMETSNASPSSRAQEFETTVLESSEIAENALRRAAELVKSFKLVAVDQHVDEFVEVELIGYLKDVLKTFQPHLRKGGHTLRLNRTEPLMLMTYPSAYIQIFSNLMMNSIQHGFDEDTGKEIHIDISDDKANVTIIYRDNGRGIDPEVQQKLFDPFFTTNRSGGSTGLGMNIVYNLITQKLFGTIHCLGGKNGAHFRLVLPKDIGGDIEDSGGTVFNSFAPRAVDDGRRGEA